MNGKLILSGATAVTAIALLAGIGLGQTMASSPARDATKDAARPAAVTTIHDVRDEVPKVCLDALDEADAGFTAAGGAMGAVKDVLSGNLSAELGLLKLNEQTATLTNLAPSYNANKAACRTAAGQ
jgi:hypothetical protein